MALARALTTDEVFTGCAGTVQKKFPGSNQITLKREKAEARETKKKKKTASSSFQTACLPFRLTPVINYYFVFTSASVIHSLS